MTNCLCFTADFGKRKMAVVETAIFILIPDPSCARRFAYRHSEGEDQGLEISLCISQPI